jgi:putative MATE family efflux protein
MVLNNLLRFQGSSFYGMIGTVTGAVLNIGLDPLLILALGMGIRGAALATIISQTVSCVLLFAGCLRGGNVPIRLKNFTPRLSVYREIFRGGMPSLLRQSLASVGAVLLNNAAKGYGDAVIAAISIVNRIAMFAGAAMMGFGQGFQPVCGFNYGAKLYARVKKGFWFCVRISSAGLLALAVLGYIFAPQVVAAFQPDPEVIAVGTVSMRIVAFSYPLIAWVIMNNMMLQTIGKSGSANVLAVARQGLFFIPLLYLLAPRLGVLGLQLVTPISDALSFLLAIPLCARALRGMKTDAPR